MGYQKDKDSRWLYPFFFIVKFEQALWNSFLRYYKVVLSQSFQNLEYNQPSNSECLEPST